MSFKVEVTDAPSGEWFSSPTRFLTKAEAEAYVAIVAGRWRQTRIIEVTDPVFYGDALDDGEGDDQ